VPRSGCSRGRTGFLGGLVDDLINKKTEKGYVMIEVRKDE